MINNTGFRMKGNFVNICYNNNNSGLTVDADVISCVLEKAGFVVYHNNFFVKLGGISRRRKKIVKICSRIFAFGLNLLSYIDIKLFRVTLHLETISFQNLKLGNKNIFIANLEWLDEDTFDLLSEIDLFLCKTKNAKQFFDEKKLPAVFTSFSTNSPCDQQYTQKRNTFVHIAGKSDLKGTLPLIRLWEKHPSWPKLTVIARSSKCIEKVGVENIDIIDSFLERKSLGVYQNEAEIHLCLSEAEGFGHYICEALSCGSIVLTVDGYPMNELVQPERGILVKTSHNETIKYTKKFYFDPLDLERMIEAVLKMQDSEKDQIKAKAKKWFEDNDAFFQREFVIAIKDCILNR